jgi:hypothetical protein
MSIDKNIILTRKSLAVAERHLRNAIVDAARDATPEQISMIARWLQTTQQLIIESANHKSDPGVASRSQDADTGTVDVPRARLRGATYPVFHRTGKTLVKVGWSKKARSEYEHKAPKSALDALVFALAEAGKRGRIFTMESLIPLVDSSTGSVIPDYQAYLGLAWLRAEALVEQHGRKGYTISTKVPLGAAVTEKWASLHAR